MDHALKKVVNFVENFEKCSTLAAYVPGTPCITGDGNKVCI